MVSMLFSPGGLGDRLSTSALCSSTHAVSTSASVCTNCVCVYYCSTYHKASNNCGAGKYVAGTS